MKLLKLLLFTLILIVSFFTYAQDGNSYNYQFISDSIKASIKKKNYTAAINFGEQLLKKHKNLKNNIPDTTAIRVYNLLGKMYNNNGESKKAHLLANDAIALLNKNNIENIELAKAYDIIAESVINYQHNEKVSEGFEGLDIALSIFKKIHKKDHFQTLMSHAENGNLYNIKGDYEACLENHLLTTKLLKNQYDGEHAELSKIYENIGATYYKKENFDEAIEYLLKGVNIKKLFIDKNRSSIASSYANLAILYYRIGDTKKALTFEEKALDIFIKTYGKKSPKTITSLNRVASYSIASRDYDKAKMYFKKSIEIQLSQKQLRYDELANNHANLAEMYVHLNNFNKAIKHKHKALLIRKFKLPSNKIAFANIYTRLSYIHLKNKTKDSAIYYGQKGLKNRDSLDYHGIASSYNNLGHVFNENRQFKKAIHCYERSIDFKQKLSNKNPFSIISSINNKIEALINDHQLNKAKNQLNYLRK